MLAAPDDNVAVSSKGWWHRHARISWLACAATAIVFQLTPIVVRPQPHLIWNASPSVPIGLYGINPRARARVGDLVAMRPSPGLSRYMAGRRYVEAGVLLIKFVAAGGGARVCRKRQRVTIDNHTAAVALERDHLGRPLPRWSGCYRLDTDQLFLLANRSPSSFDSRYFGIVRADQIVGRATPLWVWP